MGNLRQSSPSIVRISVDQKEAIALEPGNESPMRNGRLLPRSATTWVPSGLQAPPGTCDWKNDRCAFAVIIRDVYQEGLRRDERSTEMEAILPCVSGYSGRSETLKKFHSHVLPSSGEKA